MLALLFFIFILLTCFHFYYQNVILVYFAAAKKDKLYAMEDELELMKRKSVISPVLYNNLKSLFRNTESIFEPQNALTYLISSRYTGNYENSKKPENGLILSQINKTNNFQIKDLYTKYYNLLIESFALQLRASLIYIVPFILVRFFGKKFKRQIQKTASDFITNISTANIKNYAYAHC
jgi:hypothetical protein